MSEFWEHQIRAIERVQQAIAVGHTRICVSAPTGSGKGLVITELILWARSLGWKVTAYLNRRLLFDQTATRYSDARVRFGMIAAGKEKNKAKDTQLCMIQTTALRKGHGKDPARGDLVIIDEAHLNSSGRAIELIDWHLTNGTRAVVGFTATPIEIGGCYDLLLNTCSMDEARACGALVPAITFGCCEPDLAYIKKVKDEDFDRKFGMEYVQQIIGDLQVNLRKYNPRLEPTIIFAPCVASSRWIASHLSHLGIRCGHIDAKEVWLDGDIRSDSDSRQKLLDEFRSGRLPCISNRFVLREGIDLPHVKCVVSACVFGSITTYVQALGRGLRAYPGKDSLIHLDHGGNWWRHGDVNDERDWQLWHTPHMFKAQRQERLREGMDPEPICCQQCFATRSSGAKCPNCGHECPRSIRRIKQADGSLVLNTCRTFPPRERHRNLQLEDKWRQMYWRARKAGMTFLQAEACLAKENKWLWPRRDMPLMPTRHVDWFRRVEDVPRETLIQGWEGMGRKVVSRTLFT